MSCIKDNCRAFVALNENNIVERRTQEEMIRLSLVLLRTAYLLSRRVEGEGKL